MDDVQRQAAAEEIRQLKARYWRGVDMKDVALLRSVFADDARIDFREEVPPGEEAETDLPTPDAFAAHCIAMLDGVVTIHHGHNPEIAFVSDTEATAIWPMEDNLWVDNAVSVLPFRHLNGYGHYYDSYRKTADGWRISATTLKRLHVDIA